jgi:hypothetical protein
VNSKRENAVRSLTSLYTIVIGVALSLAIVQLVGGAGGLESVRLPAILMFFALLVTLFPFYHGALRHVDDVYVENVNKHIRDGALVIDVLLLFVHGLVFVVLALVIDHASQFAWILVVLISVDVVWGVFVHFGASSKSETGAEWKWLVINVVFVLIATGTLVAFDVGLFSDAEPLKIAFPIFAASLLRSMADYVWCWKFYFPPLDD